MKNKHECEDCCHEQMNWKGHRNHGDAHGPLYGLGVVGALFYFLQNASTLSAVLIGVGKALFWPAVVIFKILTLLQL